MPTSNLLDDEIYRKQRKTIDEIVKIVKDFQYNDELSDKYIKEILDEDKVYD